ncbi:MAG: cytochrome P450, partial [Myxococcota bacterium]
MSHGVLPPGPTRWNPLRTVPKLFRDPIGFLDHVQSTYGDVSYLRLFSQGAFYVHDPELVENVLLKNANAYVKDMLLREVKLVLGDGLLTSDGSFWKRQRKLAAPFLTRRQIERYAEVMRGLALDAVRALPDGEERDVHHEVMSLTLDVVNQTLFGSNLRVDPTHVGHNLDVVMDYFFRVSRSMKRLIPKWIPTRDNRNATAAVKELDEIVFSIIEQRRSEGAEGDDLLSRLLSVRDEDGSQMNDTQVRDEVITMFLAGHETSALTLAN